MNNWRVAAIVNTALIVVILIGGAFLYAQGQDTAATNSRFICGFGHALAATPLTQRKAETDKEFRTRVALTRQFVDSISEDLRECKPPPKIVIDEESQKVLREKGVVVGGGNQPSGQPSPSPGGRTPVEPTPTPAPTPSPAPASPGNSQICTPGVSPVLPAVCL